MLFMVLLFIICVLLFRFLFLWVFDSIFGESKKENTGDLTINETHVHHHYHDNRSVVIGEKK
jgi:hypothetical protein